MATDDQEISAYHAGMQAYLAARSTDTRLLQRQYDSMVNREIVLALFGGIAVIFLWRRK